MSNLPASYDYVLCDVGCPRAYNCVRHLLWRRAKAENYKYPLTYLIIEDTGNCENYWPYEHKS